MVLDLAKKKKIKERNQDKKVFLLEPRDIYEKNVGTYRTFFNPIRKLIFGLPVNLLIKIGLSANKVSLIGLFIALSATTLLISGYTYLFAILGLVYLFFDVMDGMVAKITGTSNLKGALVDYIVDNTSVLILMVALANFVNIWFILLVALTTLYQQFIYLCISISGTSRYPLYTNSLTWLGCIILILFYPSMLTILLLLVATINLIGIARGLWLFWR